MAQPFKLSYADCKAAGNTMHYLPQEIRDAIYVAYFDAYGWEIYMLGSVFDVEQGKLPSICKVFPDAIAEYLRLFQFECWDSENLSEFMEHVHALPITTPFVHIRNISLSLVPFRFQVECHSLLQDGDKKSASTWEQLKALLRNCTCLREFGFHVMIAPKGRYLKGSLKETTASTSNEDVQIILQKHWLPLFYQLKQLEKLDMTISRSACGDDNGQSLRRFTEEKLKERGLKVHVHDMEYHL